MGLALQDCLGLWLAVDLVCVQGELALQLALGGRPGLLQQGAVVIPGLPALQGAPVALGVNVIRIHPLHRLGRAIPGLEGSPPVLDGLAEEAGLLDGFRLSLGVLCIHRIVLRIPLQHLKFLDWVLLHIVRGSKHSPLWLLVVILHDLLGHIGPVHLLLFSNL